MLRRPLCCRPPSAGVGDSAGVGVLGVGPVRVEEPWKGRELGSGPVGPASRAVPQALNEYADLSAETRD